MSQLAFDVEGEAAIYDFRCQDCNATGTLRVPIRQADPFRCAECGALYVQQRLTLRDVHLFPTSTPDPQRRPPPRADLGTWFFIARLEIASVDLERTKQVCNECGHAFDPSLLHLEADELLTCPKCGW